MQKNSSPTKKNSSVPMVIISAPASPEMASLNQESGEEVADGNQLYYEDEDCQSLEDQSQLGHNRDLDFSSFTLNTHNNMQEQANYYPIAPDGGYGWVIVLAAFMSNLVVDGICNAFGELKLSFAQKFGSSDAVTSLIGSLLIGVYLLIGPVVGGLVNKFGARNTVVAGAAIAGFGLVASVAAPNIIVFMILYGIVGGIGFGLIYLPAIVIVGFYFESKRAVATGIAVAGSGVGTILIPMLSSYCIKNYDLQTTVWVLAGLVFICGVFGLLYKPLDMPEPPSDLEMKNLNQNDFDEMSTDESPSRRCHSIASRNDPENIQLDPAMQRLRNALSECENDNESGTFTPAKPHLSPVLEDPQSKTRAGSTNQNNAPIFRNRKMTLTSLTSEMASNQDLKSSRGNLSIAPVNRLSAKSFGQSLSRLSGQESTLSIALSSVDTQEFARPFNRTDVLYGGSIKNLKEFKQEPNIASYRGSVVSIPHATIAAAVLSRTGTTADLREEVADDFYDDSKCKCIPLPIRTAFSEMIDFQMLKDPIMILLCVSNLLGMMGFYIPIMFLKDLAKSVNISDELSTYLVPVFGVTNTLGRVAFGWIADRGYVSALAINNFSLVSCGILTLICPFLQTFELLVAYSAVFGFIISAYISLTSIVLADLLGLEKLTNSFGLLVVARGIASLAGSPFAGLVYDITKSYQAAFYFAGFVIVVAGLISCAVPFVFKWQRSHGQNEGEYQKDADALSGKLSVLTERSEENLTDYQRTIQSLRQQFLLLKEIDEEKRRIQAASEANGTVVEVNEEEEKGASATETTELVDKTKNGTN